MQSGAVEAVSSDAAINILQRHGLTIVSIDEHEKRSLFSMEVAIFQGVKKKDLVILSRQLSILFDAQVSMVESFQALIKQTEKPALKKILVKVLDDVEGGMALSKAMAKYPKIFSKFYTSMIKSGEVSGKLQEIFSYLAEHTEREYYLNSKIKGAMMYPAFIMSAFLIVGFLMMAFVVPQLSVILEETGQDLPLTTRALIATSHFMRDWALLLLTVPLAMAAGLWRYIKTPKGTKNRDILLLKVPILGGILRKIYLARFTENLSVLIKGGLPIIQALQVTSDVVSSTPYKEVILKTIDGVKGGTNISDVLEKYPDLFPAFITQMMKTGEKTGKLAQVLESMSKFFQREVDAMTSNLTQLIEPILIVILGIGVGILVASILMPIYNIAGGF